MSATQKPILQRLSLWLLHVFGWKLEIEALPPQKCVVIGAHHTTSWDFFAMLALMYSTNLRFSWLGKDSIFRGPLGSVLRALGGLPVNRRSSQGYVEQMARAFSKAETLQLAISPEGTRAKTHYWKTGFYYIALTAGVPISLGYADYRRKTVGFGPLLTPTGDIEQDMAMIKTFYAGITAKYPENQSVIEMGSVRTVESGTVRGMMLPVELREPEPVEAGL